MCSLKHSFPSQKKLPKSHTTSILIAGSLPLDRFYYEYTRSWLAKVLNLKKKEYWKSSPKNKNKLNLFLLH